MADDAALRARRAQPLRTLLLRVHCPAGVRGRPAATPRTPHRDGLGDTGELEVAGRADGRGRGASVGRAGERDVRGVDEVPAVRADASRGECLSFLGGAGAGDGC